MAGLTSTSHHPCKSLVPRTLKSLSFHLPSFSLSLQKPTTARYPSISTTISARYGGGGGGGWSSKKPKPKPSDDDDGVLDISSVRSDTVRLIDDKQNMVGIVSKDQALRMAEDAELDLVIISPDSDPPVLKIMDYSKYRYEQQKRKRDQQKKSIASRMDLKELKLGYNIDVHDYTVRLKAAQKFLKDGDKVKIIVNLKGRENAFKNKAIELIRRFQNDLGELAVEEAKNFRDRNMFILLLPNKAVVQKSQEPPKKKEDSVADRSQEPPKIKEDSIAGEVSASV